MPEWQITLSDGSLENFNADRLFITQSGSLVFTDIEGKRLTPALGLALGAWKKVLRVDMPEGTLPP